MTSSGCLTRTECETIAKTIKKGCTLRNYNITPFCQVTRGYLGTHSRLDLELEVGNISCFVKTLEGGNLSLCFEDTNLFGKELFVYKIFGEIKCVLPDVKTEVIPKMYYYSNETQTVVLENLCEQGFRGNEGLSFDEAHMLVTLEALAKFHSVSIGYEEYKSGELGRRYRLDEDYKDIMEPMFTSDTKKNGNKFIRSCEYGISTLIDFVVPDENLRVEYKDKFSKRMQLFFDATNDTRKFNFRKVLSHGDLWGFNTLFKYDAEDNPVESKLVDFQLSRYTPPALDLAMVIYMASDRNTFKKNLQKYYKYYYDSLKLELKRLNVNIEVVLPQEEFETTCRLYMKVAKFTWLCYRQTSQSKDETFAKVAQDVDTLFSVVLGEGRSWYVEQNVLEDEDYRNALTDILKDNMHSVKSDLVQPEECFELIQRKLGSIEYDFLGHDVAQKEGGKYELVVRIRRDEKEEEYKFVMDILQGDVIGCAKC